MEATGEQTHANRETIRRAFEAWQEGTSAITDVFAPEREYASKQEFIDEALTPFGDRFSAGERFRPVKIRSMHADGDTVIVLWDGHGIANDGQSYENSYAWFMRLRDGKVVDGTAFHDSISFNDLWARVVPES